MLVMQENLYCRFIKRIARKLLKFVLIMIYYNMKY